MHKRNLVPGEPAPWFSARSSVNDKFQFDSVAGRYVVLTFVQSAGIASSAEVLSTLSQNRRLFDDENCCHFGVSVDPEDQRRVCEQKELQGVRFFWDFDYAISELYAACRPADHADYRRFSMVLDERLRVLAVVQLNDDAKTHVSDLTAILGKLPRLPDPVSATIQAPVLIVPRLFEPDMCSLLMDYYDQMGGGRDSGFMREVDGKTVEITDPSFKRRRDQEIVDERLRNAAMHRIHNRLCPEIHKAFQFKVTRIERHIVACYDSVTGGYFSRHRDNTTMGTAHRRFAVSLNLNTGDYEGGKLQFPEFGRQTYEAPSGGAVVFSCSLLHEATPVTAGRRFAYLPFLYDDEAAKIRQSNLQYVEVGETK